MEEKLKSIQAKYSEKIKGSTSLKQLDEIFLSVFGKSGEITLLPKEFSKLSKDELQRVGPLFNQVKGELEQSIEKRRQEIKEESYNKLLNEKIQLDTSEVEIRKRKGHLHPITQFNKEIVDLFSKIGFQQYDAPQIETDYYNFQALNIPENHPARDLWDTLYIKSKGKSQKEKLLLRTHASDFQNRVMKEYKPPIRLINVGRCFRYENLDSRHEHTFDQFDLIYVDKNVSMANLQYLSEYFLKAIFGPEIKVRMRPKYYPFVEPGVGVDGLCIFCKGKGCKVCGGLGWLELAGAGMIHPYVLKEGGLNPMEYSGLAWGFGPFRMAMLKFGIDDIRIFNSADLKKLYENIT